MPTHLPTQLELAQLHWRLGDIDTVEHLFRTITPSTSNIAT
ncbi:hypothetical protein ACFOEE_11940 [Pseudoalteromonas fenneropenaei]|uniref:Uncharacterized protein n=1 Tax=Pseudoalteromonas fenneropenaei TaxID=1737459 RepID=A0ABV7CKY2_9GAMM